MNNLYAPTLVQELVPSIKDKILSLCIEKMQAKGVSEDLLYKNRLKDEIKQVGIKGGWDYINDLYEKNIKYPKNENNLIIMWLLGIVDDFDINLNYNYTMEDTPDIDLDYSKEVRNYLKNVWAKKTFGEDNVCSIGNYTTFGIKSTLIDMARVYGIDRTEILNLTTKLGLKDDDGKALTLDKAMEMHPDLKAWCDKYPDVTQAVRKIINRNRGMGKHAGGLIISKSPINNLVPLVKGKDGANVSAFVEGLHGSDLSPLGLVKFDLLVITNLMQIALACKLIKERYNLNSICALPDRHDWSDDSYLNDPLSLKMANEGKLKCIFQFDSDGIRELAKKGGVDSFDDLVAYTSLFRPGPMGSNLHNIYCERKKGKPYDLHPLLKPILGKTHVLCYQEQIMQIFNVAGKFPLPDCYKIIKAISKKKGVIFEQARDKFIIECQNTLGYTQEQAIDFFEQLAKFSEYAFNKSHGCAYSVLSARLLYLKSHYPLEFFSAILSCETDYDKIKAYKLESERNGIKVNKVDLNKSGTNFKIVRNDDGKEEIYMGFSNIKGIGEDVAKKIVNSQPYTSFQDFLNRCGCDSAILKPLIGIKIFGDDRVKLHEYWEYYKDKKKKREERIKRFNKNIQTRLEELKVFIPDATFDTFSNQFEDKEILKIIKKYKNTIESTRIKEEEEVNNIVKYDDFVPTGEIEEKYKLLYSSDLEVAENAYYGFGWEHILERSPDYKEYHTFDDFEKDEDIYCKNIYVRICQKPKERQSKKGTKYYIVYVEDANWRQQMITFWEEDYLRFKEELEYWKDDNLKGHLLSIRLRKPEDGFSSYTFDSPPKWRRSKEIPKDKKDDARLIVLRQPGEL